MLYYEFKLTSKTPFSIPESKSNEKSDWARMISIQTEELNGEQDHNVHFFVVEALPEYLKLCASIGYKNKKDPKMLALQFAKDLGFDADEAEVKEIQIHTLAQNARQADCNYFINDEDEPLTLTSIGSYNMCSDNDYSEFIAEKDYKIETAKEDAEETTCGIALQEEVDRIYTRQEQKTFIGNPVQYILYCDDWNVAQNIAKVIVRSIHSNGRLGGGRVALVKPQPRKRIRAIFEDSEDRLNMGIVERLYAAQRGCTLIVKPGKTTDDDNVAQEEDFHIEELASFVNEYNVETLSILVFRKTEKSIAERLKSCTPSVRYIEIEEQPFFREKAIELLEKKAAKDSILNTCSLVSKISEEERAYCISDVNRIYNQWLNDRLPTEVYPQYKDIKTNRIHIEKSKGSAYSKLQSLIGLKQAKEVIQQALDFQRTQKLFENAGVGRMKPARHMVFTGNPGTAKTTVARLFAQIMKDNKVLEKGDLIEVGRKDLVGKYVGWTAKLVEEAFNKAKGSVLFIDEAYSLYEERGGLFGDEAINTIVQMMENRRDDTIVVFAGYPNKMEEFLDKNPGLRSRIAFNVHFDDYSTSELVDIFHLIADEGKILLASGVEERLSQLFEEARKGKDFGNGRYARNVFEQARMKQASRLVNMKEEELTEQAIRTLTVEDFSTAPVATTKQESRVLGFAC